MCVKVLGQHTHTQSWFGGDRCAGRITSCGDFHLLTSVLIVFICEGEVIPDIISMGSMDVVTTRSLIGGNDEEVSCRRRNNLSPVTDV